ncbi:helix-turn-helix domain-containing protein [Paenibacillus thalictri]|uniref:AraC family transcriptional regulator n=1 Tax=Paenibacillus thalictri TaxID=2527873 RepID=A0A4Q9DES7_9BACL|nr:helix-turn-helix domain-containing protein [Paenibacillus thalictri]TBL70267.1 AraC family transcriptional regulator [Paenibacillus thalictri]
MKKWFYRLLLSYLPIFLVIVFVVIFISFLAMKDFSQKEAETANRLFLSYVKQTIEHSLKDIDNTVIKSILTDKSITQFFYPTSDMNRYVVNSQAAEKIQSLIGTNPMIHSIYFVRLSDHAVMSRNALMPVEEFGDREFIIKLLQDKDVPQNWSVLRSYYEFFDQKSSSVVTLVRKVPLQSGSDGFVVVNVGIDLIEKSLDDIYKSNTDLIHVVDKDGKLLFGTDVRNTEVQHTPTEEKGLPGIKSDYTGWEFRSGIGSNIVYNVFSVFSYIWIVFMLIAVCSGAVWIVLITRRNYKPIERIMGHIQRYSLQKSVELIGEKANDEFNFISSALDKLIEQSNEVRKQHEETQHYRRKYVFYELLHDADFNSEEWGTQMRALGLPEYAEQWSLAVFEMDQYAAFNERYPSKDQHLLKFVLGSVIKEIADQHHLVVWTEWISGHHLVALYQWTSKNDIRAAELCENVRKWVEQNLDFTVTVGVGNAAFQINDIQQSYEEASEALKYKSSLGGNRVIELEQVWARSPGSETSKHVQIIRSLTQSFRLGEEDWLMKMNKLFDDLGSEIYTRDDIVSLMNYMMFHIFREISDFPLDIKEIWTKDALPRLNDLLSQFETSDDLRAGCLNIFSDALHRIDGQRDHRDNRQLIQDVKDYVEHHFNDPDLSLAHLGDVFQISSKYVSQLFKEAFGEKFSDYLTKIRVENAKTWLAETDMPVQDIALKAGYVHTFSFIRVFKKMVGMTPGDYRKEFRQQFNS